MQVLLITPPFTQLNTPYPATAYIKGYLETIGQQSVQQDLGIETILSLFSEKGLKVVFERATNLTSTMSENSLRIYKLKETYIHTIDAVIQFLQDEDPTLAYLICERHILPEAGKFDQLDDMEWAYGHMGIRDQARHLATLYLEDIGDFISEVIDPYFGFSRYAERISISARSFDGLYTALNADNSYISELMLNLLEQKIQETNPQLVCLSVPFPGNLFAALKCGQWIKAQHPTVRVVMGGGYPNTELRSISDTRVFEFIDFITLDDGETPLRLLLEHLKGIRIESMLKRCFSLIDGQVIYNNGALEKDVSQEQVGTPCYKGLPLKKYLSVIQLSNPMHRLWTDGRWNKLTMAHGCYWGKCTFCDISLSYIKDYEVNSAKTIVDRMEKLVAETGQRGFHFVDEAAPPSLMKAVALEILRRKIVVTWWTNIRFEKSFHYDLCRLLAASGCVAVSGGLEVASDRLLKLIAKGVTVKQVTQVADNFTSAGIMVHAYLMYGFPTQTDQETIDSLEVVRQLFETGVLQSGFWHRFAMTAHSPVGITPDNFDVTIADDAEGTFANNDLEHHDPTGTVHERYSAGLKKSIYNYMHKVCLDHPLQNWFDHEVPNTSLSPQLISSYLDEPNRRAPKGSSMIIWTGGILYSLTKNGNTVVVVESKQSHAQLDCTAAEALWLEALMPELPLTYEEVSRLYTLTEDFGLFWYGNLMEELKSIGLLVL